jgi:5'-nucleotidase
VPLILLTNDDGISAAGLRCLEESLLGLADVFVVAPDRERSAVSHGLTIQSPLELGKIDARHFTLNGTPADCIIYSVTRLLPSPPDLVVSGINHGANLGDDIMYSGTVAAAREASRRGIPAVAASQAFDEKPILFREGARFIRTLVRAMLQKKSESGAPLNVNFPVGPVRGVKVTRQGTSSYFTDFNVLDRFNETGDEQSVNEGQKTKVELLSDFQAIVGGYISITPLQRDQTDYAAAKALHDEFPRILRGRGLPRLGLIRYGN